MRRGGRRGHKRQWRRARGGGRIEDNVITLGGILLSLGRRRRGREAACTASESDSSRRRRRCRSDSPEIEIATFPFFSLSLSLYHVPRSLLRPQKLSHLLPSVAASSDKRGKEKRRLVSLTSFAGESLERRHEVKPRKPEWKFQMPLFGRRSISRMSSSCSRHFRRDLLPIQNISSPETQFTAR